MSEMQIPTNKKKAEALSRMKALGIYKPIVNQFKSKGIVSTSEAPFGACFWIDESLQARVKAFEEQYNALVYHIVRSYTSFGIMNAYLYVSDHEHEWEMDNEDIQDRTPFVWVENESAPDCSEFGHIEVRLGPAAGLLRIA